MARGKSKSKGKRGRQAQEESSGGCLFPLVFSLLVLGVVAWASVTVEIGDRTLWEHGRTLAGFGEPQTRPTPGRATPDVARELERKPPRPEKPALAEPAPVEHITDEDRRALEALLPD